MSKENQLNINEIFSLAVQNQKKNNNKVAKDLYNQILKINPNLVEAHNNLGFIFRLEGQIDKAKECYKKVIETTGISKVFHVGANEDIIS